MTGQLTVHEYLIKLGIAKWNAIIPPCALRVSEEGKHIRYLHPTKGWRRVAVKRLAMLAA